MAKGSASKSRRVERVRARDGDNCCFCGKPMLFDRPDNIPAHNWGHANMRATIEHVLDRSYGGTNNMHNLRLAHRRCNNRFAATHPERKALFYRTCTQ